MTDMPDPSDLRRTGYRIMPAEVWDQARDDYLRGEAASLVCQRYGLNLSTFRGRAAAGGWRRSDQPPVVRGTFIEMEGSLDECGTWDLSEMAWMRLQDAIMNGRASDAAGWLTLHQRLNAQAREEGPDDPDSDYSHHSDCANSAPESEISP